MKDKYCFVDMINTGHHWFYNYNLIKGLCGENDLYYWGELNKKQIIQLKEIKVQYNNQKKFSLNNKVMKELYMLILLFKVLRFCKKNKVTNCWFLYLDEFIITLPFVNRIFSFFNIKVGGTLHWYPKGRNKERLLKKLTKNGVKVVVHTKYMKQKFGNYAKVKIINYPINTVDTIKSKEKSSNDKYNILYFGGTRHDKGLDILLDALYIIDISKIELVVAGKIEYFNESFIKSKIEKYKDISVKLDLGFINNKEMERYFREADIIVLPYRREFSGESGIFTESFNYEKPVIVPDIIHFSEIIEKYSNGLCFKVENSNDLSEKIITIISNYKIFKENATSASKQYKNNHSINNFIKNYNSFIKDKR